MPAHKAGTARVSSTVTKRNPRPRKYASASERQAAYRARAPEVCFRADEKTKNKLDEIAETLDQPRADLLLSMTKFALANHDWARFGLTHRPLPYGYGLAQQEFIGPRQVNPQPIWKRTRPKSLGKPVPLTPKQKAAAKKRAAAAGRKYPNLVDNIAAARMENPTVKKPTPAQLAARARFAEMARSGAFKRKAKKAKANPAKKTVSQKISQLTREGYPQKQAIAIALSEQRAGKVKATPRKRKANPMPSQVTETIYQQLGGNRFAMMTGAKNFVAYPDLLEFSIPRNASSANRVRVFYEPGSDLYTLSFVRTSGTKSTEIARFEDTYADQLQPLFTQVTGMYTSLGTMGRKTNPRASNPATGRKGSGTKLNPKPRMAKIAWLTPGGQREVMEVPIDFAFKEYIGNIQEDFFARTDDGFLVVTEKSTGMKVGQVPHTMRAAALNDRAAAKRFVQSIVEKVGAPGFRAAIAKHPRIA